MMNDSREIGDGNSYRTMPVTQIRMLRDKLYLISVNKTYQPETRTLARMEIDYMDNMIAFRDNTTVSQRARLVREGLTPWQGTWRREE